MKQRLGIIDIFRRAFILSILSVLALSCVKDSTMDTLPQDNRVGLLLNIDTPTDVVTSRTGESTAEFAIMRGYLYVFKKNGDYHSHEAILGDDMTILDRGTNTPKIFAKILTDATIPEKNWVVLILNHAENEPASPEAVRHSTIDEYFSITGSGDAEPTGFYDITEGLPMYGEIENWSASSEDMTVRCSVAKLLVQIGASLGDESEYTTGFTTANVTYGIFNHAISGKIKDGGDILNYSDTNEDPHLINLGDALVNKKTVGVSVDCSGATADAVSYIYEYPYATKRIGLEKSVKVPISPTEYSAESKNRLAIILKLNRHPAANRFYRLDLARQEDPSTSPDGVVRYLDIKRNHQYRIIINAVHDSGYTTATEAINGIPSNVDFALIDDSGGTAIGNSNKYAISIGKESTKIVHVMVGSNATISLASGVRYILNSVFGGTLPAEAITTNDIKVFDVTSGTSSTELKGNITKLTAAGESLNVTIPTKTSVGIQKIKYQIKLGTVTYMSDEYIINWADL